MHASIIKNSYNFSAHQIIEISLVSGSTYIIPRDPDKVIFYVNNYIN